MGDFNPYIMNNQSKKNWNQNKKTNEEQLMQCVQGDDSEDNNEEWRMKIRGVEMRKAMRKEET